MKYKRLRVSGPDSKGIAGKTDTKGSRLRVTGVAVVKVIGKERE